MRILLLTQLFQPEPAFKGLPFAKGLAAMGHHLEVVTGFPNYPQGRLYPGYRVRMTQRESIDGISILRLPVFPSHDESALRRTASYLTFGASAALLAPLQITPPDVIYVYNLITLGLASRLARWLHGCRIVLDVQDIWPESVSSAGMIKNRWLLRPLGQWCDWEYRRVDHLTVLSPGFKHRLVDRGVSEGQVDVIYNWCDETKPNMDEEERRRLRKAHGFEGRINILFAGNIGKAQALEVALAAAVALRHRQPRVLFTFLGDGLDVERLKALAHGMENVQFLPRCGRPEAMRLISIADAMLVHIKDDPLFAITIPSKTQACMYAGKPILMGVRGDAADLIRKSAAGIVFQPENADSLVAAVEALIKMPDSERVAMGIRGRTYYDEHLSFARGLRRFDRVFRRLMNGCDTAQHN